MSEAAIRTAIASRVATVTIDNPAAMNALNVPLLLELEQVVQELIASDEVSVLVFTGAGDKAFIAGGDIADIHSRYGLAHYFEFAEIIHRVFRLIEQCDKPTIASINGWALGGGVELLLCTDMRICAEQAKLGVPEIGLGVFPGAGGATRLMRQIAPCRARELMFLGEPISASVALEIGLINRVVPAPELAAETAMLATKIADKSPMVLRLLKRNLREGANMPLSAALAHEQAMIALVMDTTDAHEGTAAFLEKRKPLFRGE